jgi:hypothetical protein
LAAGDLRRMGGPGWLPAGAGAPIGAAALALCRLGIAVADGALESHRTGLQRVEEWLLVEVQTGPGATPRSAPRPCGLTRASARPASPGEPRRLQTFLAGRGGSRYSVPPRCCRCCGCDRHAGRTTPGAVDTEHNAPRNPRGGLRWCLHLDAEPVTRGVHGGSGRPWPIRRLALPATLAVGAAGCVSHEPWRLFYATGIAHRDAISGLHVTLSALVGLARARRLFRLLVLRGLRQRSRGLVPVRCAAQATPGIAWRVAASLSRGARRDACQREPARSSEPYRTRVARYAHRSDRYSNSGAR